MATEKKKFFEIEIPLINYRMNVLATSADTLPGKIIKLDLTKILKGKNVDGTIMIEKIDGKLEGRFIGMRIMPSFIRRMIRSNTSYIEDSFKCKNFIIKPYMLTRKRVHRSVRKALRNETKLFLCDYVNKATNSEQVFLEAISGRLQKSLAIHLKKIYPLAFCEIRMLQEKKQ